MPGKRGYRTSESVRKHVSGKTTNQDLIEIIWLGNVLDPMVCAALFARESGHFLCQFQDAAVQCGIVQLPNQICVSLTLSTAPSGGAVRTILITAPAKAQTGSQDWYRLTLK